MLHRAGILAVALVIAAAWRALAQDAGVMERRGAALVTRHCAMCHAVGRYDDSVEREAPPMRAIARRIPLERLQSQLGAGLLGGHPRMPKFTFEPRDAAAIVRYLRSIQEP